MIVRMKTLYSTPKVRSTSSGLGEGNTSVEAWFELNLHEGPPDPTSWEGSGGQTVAYWREQFKRLRDPRRVRFTCYDVNPDAGSKPLPNVPEALIPMDVLESLPEDARISLMWTVCPVTE
jgi:hypothetical protein